MVAPHPRRLPASVLRHAASRVIPRSPPSPGPSSPGDPARPQGPPPGLRPPLCFLVPQMFLSLTMTTCQWNSAARASRSGFLRAAGRLKAPASLAAEWGSGSAAPLGSRSRPGTHTRRRVQRGSAHAHPGARAVARFHAPWREGQGWSCGGRRARGSASGESDGRRTACFPGGRRVSHPRLPPASPVLAEASSCLFSFLFFPLSPTPLPHSFFRSRPGGCEGHLALARVSVLGGGQRRAPPGHGRRAARSEEWPCRYSAHWEPASPLLRAVSVILDTRYLVLCKIHD